MEFPIFVIPDYGMDFKWALARIVREVPESNAPGSSMISRPYFYYIPLGMKFADCYPGLASDESEILIREVAASEFSPAGKVTVLFEDGELVEGYKR